MGMAGGAAGGHGGEGAYGEKRSGEQVAIEEGGGRQQSLVAGESQKTEIDQAGEKHKQNRPEAEGGGAR
jgi:hypothetical protein